MSALALTEVTHAAAVLDGVAHRTPVLTCVALDLATGASVLCKAENFQRTGSFKFRGAYNAIAALSPEARRHGVCTVSSGNHAQAVALAARLHDAPAVVAMPTDAPEVKRAAVEAYGAEIVTYDRWAMPQWQAGEQIQHERGLPFISSHDDPLISAGAGTAMVELLGDAGPVDVLVAAVGGGGGLAGYATVLREHHSAARIVAAEPAGRGLLAESLAAGERLERPVPATIADGLQLTRIGALPLRILRSTVDHVVGVTDEQIIDAMRFAFHRMKVVLEPSGATALAAVLTGSVAAPGQRVAVILTGGNVGAATFCQLLHDRPEDDRRTAEVRR